MLLAKGSNITRVLLIWTNGGADRVFARVHRSEWDSFKGLGGQST